VGELAGPHHHRHRIGGHVGKAGGERGVEGGVALGDLHLTDLETGEEGLVPIQHAEVALSTGQHHALDRVAESLPLRGHYDQLEGHG